MERELYALWQGVTQHDRLIKGFKIYVYIDHKNNLFTEAQLDNRRRGKKMSNWALELQQFNICRVWIRGEATILADAHKRIVVAGAHAAAVDDDGVEDVLSLLIKSLVYNLGYNPGYNLYDPRL